MTFILHNERGVMEFVDPINKKTEQQAAVSALKVLSFYPATKKRADRGEAVDVLAELGFSLHPAP
jgi:hypothetical protein